MVPPPHFKPKVCVHGIMVKIGLKVEINSKKNIKVFTSGWLSIL